MPMKQQPIFTTGEDERFAVLWAGFDTGNGSEAEAMGKGRLLRRMVAGKGLRIVDALELREIRAALDAQMQPARAPVPDVAVLEEKLQNLEEQLSESLNDNLTLTDALARLQGRPQRNGSIARPLLTGFLALGLAAECVVAVIGLIGGDESAKRPEPMTAAIVLEANKPEAERTKPATKQEYRPDARPKAKQKPLPVVGLPEEPVPVAESSPVRANGRLRKIIQSFATVPVKPESPF